MWKNLSKWLMPFFLKHTGFFFGCMNAIVNKWETRSKVLLLKKFHVRRTAIKHFNFHSSFYVAKVFSHTHGLTSFWKYKILIRKANNQSTCTIRKALKNENRKYFLTIREKKEIHCVNKEYQTWAFFWESKGRGCLHALSAFYEKEKSLK